MQIISIVVTGGREFADGARIEADLRAFLPLGLVRVAEGQSRGGGADDLAHEAWRRIASKSTVRYPVDAGDGKHRGTPLARNARMIAVERPDLVLAYPDPTSHGTWHCVAEAVKRSIPVVAWVPWASPLPPRHPETFATIRTGLAKYLSRAALERLLTTDRGGHHVVIEDGATPPLTDTARVFLAVLASGVP